MHSLLNSAIDKADILLLQEPWISKELTTITHPWFTPIIPSPKEGKRPRVISFILKNGAFETTERIDLINDEDCQILDIKSNNFDTFRIINVYNEKQQKNDIQTHQRGASKIRNRND
jgi:hypothetical protein